MNLPYNEQLVVQMRKEIVAFLKEREYEPGPELTVAMINAIYALAMEELIKEDKKGDDDGSKK